MKKVVITGASSGIGLALSKVFAKNSYDLVLVARRQDRLFDLKRELENNYGISVDVEVMDLGIKENLEILSHKYKDTDILINNAGFGKFGNFLDSNLNEDVNMINLNISSLVILTKLFSSTMKKTGKIVNIGSTAGFQPIPLMSVYGASKSFVNDFTLAIQQEITEPQIVLFCPGETKTEFQEVAKRPKSSPLRGKIPSAMEVAEYLYKELEKERKFIIWGFYNRFLLGFQRFFPKNLIAKIIYKTQKR